MGHSRNSDWAVSKGSPRKVISAIARGDPSSRFGLTGFRDDSLDLCLLASIGFLASRAR